MKMSPVSGTTITGFLLLCLGSQISYTDSQKVCDYYGVKDGNVTVPLKHKMDDIDTLRWNHNGTTLVNRRKGIIIGGKEYVSKNGSLLLKNLQEYSSGKYTPELFDEDGKNKLVSDQSMTLCVLDRVTMPTVKTVCSKDRKSVTFTCKVGQAKDVSFGWLQNDEVLVKEKGQHLTVHEKVEKDAFRCKVSNQVSTMISTPVKETCFKRDPGFPQNLLGEYGWFILAGGGGAVVLVLMIIVIVCCVRTRRRKKVVQLKEEEELRMMVTNPSQHHHHHHHNHGHQHNHPPHPHPHPHPQAQPQQQPAGHTGPRQHRSKQQRPKAPNPPNPNPQPSPKRPTQEKGPRGDEEQPPPLPQPRKKAPRTHNRV